MFRVERSTIRVLALGASLGLLAVPRAWAGAGVSPGGERSLVVRDACPTFSWASAKEAATELRVWRLDAHAEPAAKAALRKTFPAGATSWTPSRDECLAPGRYAWTVHSGDEAWAPRLLFEVPAETSLSAAPVGPTSEAPTPSEADSHQRPVAGRPEADAAELKVPAALTAFQPPACVAGQEVFADVPASHPFCAWIQQLYGDAVTGGCGVDPPRYCKDDPLTRGQMAVFLERAMRGTATWAPGDITAVAAGTGLTGGGESGHVELSAAIPFEIAVSAGHRAKLAGPGFGGLGDTGVESWGNTGTYGYGDSTGVWGETGNPGGIGVRGNATTGGTGVYGLSNGSGLGVFGETISGAAVRGRATAGNGYGGYFTNPSTSVILATADPALAGDFYGGVKIQDGNTTVTLATTLLPDQIHVAGFFEGDVRITGGLYLTGGCSGCAPAQVADASGTVPSVGGDSGARALLTTSSGAYLSSGGTWVNASDASVKENFAPVDGANVLARVGELPIQSWNYIADGPGVRHIGPTAQDFEAAFGLGGGDTAISTIDPSGIALVAIQELARRLQARDAEIAELQARLAALESRR